MSNSLRDQMLKAGLVSKKQAKKLEQQNKQKVRQQRKQKKDITDENSVSYIASQKQKEEIARTKELNRLKEEKRLQKEQQSQIRDIIKRHTVNEPDADIVYNFVVESDKLVKQIFVTLKQQQQLINGYLAIAFVDDNYHLIPAPVADKLLERVPEIIVCYNNDTDSASDGDDPYADYQIPDDLMW
ncbi:DUF2058 domain-containing protein [Candidatus Halobeggiatoa sp. HSG11]|nr:DUF2058 domain-containing protein [Candidatus Halobeggiatoa sp. HSG11]